MAHGLTPDQQERQAAARAAARRATPHVGTFQATVVQVVPGGASDGRDRCVISWRGTNIAVPYHASYTPVVGHRVAVDVTGSQLIVRDRIVGTP